MRLHLYILRAHAGPFFFSVFTLMFIFLLQFIMKFIDQLIGKGLGGWVVSELILLSLAWMVVLAVPMSVLVATLMAFGAMSSHHEVTAMKSGGMSFYKMLSTIVLSSILVALLLVQFNNKVLPEANHRVKALIFDIRRTKPTLSLVPGLFSQELSGYSILVRKTFEQSNELEGVTIYDYTNAQENVVVTAERGNVSFTPDFQKVVMDLTDGEIHQLSATDPNAYRRLRFVRHRIVMNAEGFDFERSSENAFSRGDRELGAEEMVRIVDSLKASAATAQERIEKMSSGILGNRTVNKSPAPTTSDSLIHQHSILLALNRARSSLQSIENTLISLDYTQKEINRYLVEIHKKYSIPAAAIVFVFIGAPLGIMARRGTFGVAASLSLGFFLLYWACLIGGEKLADRGIIAPWLGMWMANIFLALLGAYLTYRAAKETPQLRFDWIQKLVPKFLRAPQSPDETEQSLQQTA